MMSVNQAICKRRSIRRYLSDAVPDSDIHKILFAATMAPSGKNKQPWKFAVVTDNKILKLLSKSSLHGRFLKEAPCAILVYLDKKCSYDFTKDSMAVGACIQNILLTATELGYGSCWIGGIDTQNERLKILLDNDEHLLLMSVITIGFSNEQPNVPQRKSTDQVSLIIKNFG